jgi:hypothetical protein
MMIKRLMITAAWLFAGIVAQAQYATIKGFVYAAENGEPIPFASVFMKGTTMASFTDINGYYSIVKIQPGTYQLVATTLGYDTVVTEVVLKADDMLNKKLILKRRNIDLKQVEVSAEKQTKKTEVKIAVESVTPQDIKSLPSLGAEGDLVQYMQVVPGVVSSGDQGGQLYIRGGTPVQNKVLLDGMVIYNPFHSIGLFSVFDTDILKNTDVYTAGFGAQYGGRISSVMDITTRDGNKKRFGGKVSTGTFLSKLLLEGPVKKAKDENDGTASFILSVKNSYLDQTSKSLYKYASDDGLPYSFNDIYGKFVVNSASGSKASFFGFNFTDKVNYSNVARYDWTSSGGGMNFVLVPGSSKVLLRGNLAFSSYKIKLTEAEEKPRSSLVNGFNMGFNWLYFLNNDEINYGIEVQGFKTDFEYFNYAKRQINQTENTTEIGVFLRYKKIIANKLIIDPSIRLQYYASISEFSPEPRLGLKYNLSDNIRLKAAGGLYAQNLIAANSDRDVVNFFYGFLSAPDDLPTKFDGKSIKKKLQLARHAVVGVEYDINKHFDLNIEGYIKDFNQLTNINRDKVYDDVAANYDKPDSVKKSFIIEKGFTQGVDVVLKYEYRRFYAWIVYSLGFSTRNTGNYEYAPHFDRRHNINVVGSYKMGKKVDWEVDVRWNFGSGFPFTLSQGYYPYLNFQDGLSTDYTQNNGELGILYGPLNESRLPTYHRLDLSVKKKFYVARNNDLEVVASVVNVYNRKNVFYVDRVRYKVINQLPIMPSIGASLTF